MRLTQSEYLASIRSVILSLDLLNLHREKSRLSILTAARRKDTASKAKRIGYSGQEAFVRLSESLHPHAQRNHLIPQAVLKTIVHLADSSDAFVWAKGNLVYVPHTKDPALNSSMWMPKEFLLDIGSAMTACGAVVSAFAKTQKQNYFLRAEALRDAHFTFHPTEKLHVFGVYIAEWFARQNEHFKNNVNLKNLTISYTQYVCGKLAWRWGVLLKLIVQNLFPALIADLRKEFLMKHALHYNLCAEWWKNGVCLAKSTPAPLRVCALFGFFADEFFHLPRKPLLEKLCRYDAEKMSLFEGDFGSMLPRDYGFGTIAFQTSRMILHHMADLSIGIPPDTLSVYSKTSDCNFWIRGARMEYDHSRVVSWLSSIPL